MSYYEEEMTESMRNAVIWMGDPYNGYLIINHGAEWGPGVSSTEHFSEAELFNSIEDAWNYLREERKAFSPGMCFKVREVRVTFEVL